MNRPAEHKRNALIRKRLEAEQPQDEALAESQREASVNLLWRIWYGLRGYALEDIIRLREAGVSMVEGRADEKHAQNKKADAEATKAYMEAEVLKQKAARERLGVEAERLRLSRERLDLEEQELDVERGRAAALERQAEAYERVLQAIEVIKARGGDVFFDSEQVEEGLRRLSALPEHAASEGEAEDGP